jgi:hypothetical protein
MKVILTVEVDVDNADTQRPERLGMKVRRVVESCLRDAQIDAAVEELGLGMASIEEVTVLFSSTTK